MLRSASSHMRCSPWRPEIHRAQSRDRGLCAHGQRACYARGQMINASSSIMPIPITSTASATGSYSSQCRLCMYMRRPLLELSAAPTNRSPTSACTRTSNSIAAASVPVARASHRADCLTRSHASGSRSQLSVFGCEFAGEVLVKGLVRAGIS
jgi:hypothetical protein